MYLFSCSDNSQKKQASYKKLFFQKGSGQKHPMLCFLASKGSPPTFSLKISPQFFFEKKILRPHFDTCASFCGWGRGWLGSTSRSSRGFRRSVGSCTTSRRHLGMHQRGLQTEDHPVGIEDQWLVHSGNMAMENGPGLSRCISY